MRHLTTVFWLLIAAVVLALPLLPVPGWVDAPDQGPLWRPHLESWGLGLLVVGVLALLAGRIATASQFRPRLPRVSDRNVVIAVAILTTVAAAVTHYVAFAGNPNMVDEMAQLLHSRALAAGRLALPVPHPLEAFVVTHTAVTDAGWVSQFPPGQTMLLAAGLLVGLPGIINPVLAGASGVLLFVVARGLYGSRTARTAALLWLLSAWVMFTSASFMSHVGAVAFALLAAAAIATRARIATPRAMLAGVAIGLCTITRPLDGVAAAVPVYLWLLLRRDWRGVGVVTLAGLPIAAGWAWFNWRLFGDPFTVGYTALYGEAHGLGFHTDPWGRPFTPAVALANLAVGIRRLHQYAFEWPIPALLPLGLWAACVRPRRSRDLVLACGILAAPALYFFYWYSGFYLGPRFFYSAFPWMIIGTARAWQWSLVVGRRWRTGPIYGPAVAWGVASAVVVWGALGVLPLRWHVHSEGLRTLKLHPERELAALGVPEALVLVKESWASRIIVRLWAVGASPGQVERAYRVADACVLDQIGRAAQAGHWPRARVTQALDSLLVAAQRTGPAPLADGWPDRTLRVTIASLTPTCREEMREDLTGFTAYGSLAWQNPVDLRTGIVFARDLPELRDALLALYPDRPVYRWAPPPATPDSLPVLTLIRPAP